MPADAASPPVAVRYGAHPAQYYELHRPAGPGPRPVVVLIHGGFWRLPWDRTLMRPLAEDLVARGYAAVNLEYRRLGEDGGGWPGSCADVEVALRRLGEQGDDDHSLDLDAVALVGHSAGGHLALWVAHHTDLDVRLVVSQAGVADLRAAVRDRLDEENGKPPAALEFMGAPPEEPRPDSDVYSAASPIELLPLGRGVRQLVLHGDADNRVPQQQSLDYARAAEAAGDDVRLVGFTGMGHFELIDPAHESWQVTMAELAGVRRPPSARRGGGEGSPRRASDVP
ncbi:MAG TPA: alpha/beta hydrolase [Actinospica sp.]|nr:alpha/beta hydrolase [Actinospica sp.]